jgi:hypothetical protein
VSYQSPIYTPEEFLAVRIRVPNEPRYAMLFPQQSYGLMIALSGLLRPALMERGDIVEECAFVGAASNCVGLIKVVNVASVAANLRALLRPMLLDDSFVAIYSYDAREQIFRPADAFTKGGMVLSDLEPLNQEFTARWRPFTNPSNPRE